MRCLRLAVGIAAFAVACNPFQTGTPESPIGALIPYPQPTSTDSVLKIIALALHAKDSPAYMDRLAEDFVFIPDPVQRESEEFRNFPERWDRAHEEVFLAGLLSNADSLVLEWHDVLTQPQAEGAFVTAIYDLTIWPRAQPAAHYHGRADLFMQQRAGVWNIQRWNDVVLEGITTTWGLLRAKLLATG